MFKFSEEQFPPQSVEHVEVSGGHIEDILPLARTTYERELQVELAAHMFVQAAVTTATERGVDITETLSSLSLISHDVGVIMHEASNGKLPRRFPVVFTTSTDTVIERYKDAELVNEEAHDV